MIQKMGSVAVAYSGGVDSSLLLKVCKDVLGDKVLAVIGVSQTFPEREINYAVYMAKKLGVKYFLIKTDELKNKNFINNSSKRCYWCKHQLFSEIKKIAKKNKITSIVDGSNYDDLFDYRAGFLAAKKLNIRKPLLEAKLKKKEIRQISKALKLPTWNKPSFACLASRFPYGSRITKEKLIKINTIEEYIMNFGIKQIRVRDFSNIAKIDVLEEDFKKVIRHKEKIIKYIKKKGFNFVVLDLEGYKTGSLNRLLKNNR
ncbi:MAG: ATP-dependent sacrificial sulfur transferase LarE [Candidatus Omnitrophica bacterium]|nr:ATP-dependent sacrificial sulfur transferase LarE [Candidatus Omnitrophota bacterium]